MKLTTLRAHTSYEDFVTLLEEINEIHYEDCKEPSTTKDTGLSKGLSTTKAGGLLRHTSFPDSEPEYRGYPGKNDRGLDISKMVLKNHIKAYAAVNKFNLVHVLNNEYKIVMRDNFEHSYQLLTSYFAEVRLVDPDLVFDIQTITCKNKRFT
ncbi:hypothetical protein GIB67_006278, partial [Kingdonia uniflora]